MAPVNDPLELRMQKVISGLLVLVATLGVVAAVGAQLQLSAPPATPTVQDSSSGS